MDAVPAQSTPLVVENWGLLEYQSAFERQAAMVNALLVGQQGDTLVYVEHPATVTLGRRATTADLHLPEAAFAEKRVTLQRINRGGLATAHEPGQFVVYPVIRLKKKDLRWYADQFLGAVVNFLADYGIEGYLKKGEPGVWVSDRKICSFGIALKKWVSCHGIALNMNNNLETFDLIVPCGRPDEQVTSLTRELGHLVDMAQARLLFTQHFCQAFGYHIQARR